MPTKKELDLIKEISLWNPGCEAITLSTILSKIRVDGKLHVINSGAPGTGKSYSSIELVKLIDPDNTIFLDNTTTDRGLFEVFMEFPNSDILLDECSTLLRSLRTQDMIKLCMESKPLTWTKKDTTETTEPFTGTIIINTNIFITDSVSDRCLYNEAVMNRDKALSFLDVYQNKDSKKHEDFIAYCKERIKDSSNVKLTKKEEQTIIDFVREKISVADENQSFSRRIVLRQLNYFERAKKFFKELSPETMKYLFKISEAYITNNHTPSLIEHILSNGAMDKPRLVKEVAKRGKYSEQHARRLINEDIKTGKLLLKGKHVELKK
jgi:hypothetical protein